jgi:hypothetical protein
MIKMVTKTSDILNIAEKVGEVFQNNDDSVVEEGESSAVETDTEKVENLKENLMEFMSKEEKRWFMTINEFGIAPLESSVAGVTQHEIEPDKRNVRVLLDKELVEKAPNIIVAGILVHELKHVNQVKSGEINRINDRPDIEKGAYQHERKFLLRHREEFSGNMRNAIDERIAQIDQLIKAYQDGEMMLLANDLQISRSD